MKSCLYRFLLLIALYTFTVPSALAGDMHTFIETVTFPALSEPKLSDGELGRTLTQVTKDNMIIVDNISIAQDEYWYPGRMEMIWDLATQTSSGESFAFDSNAIIEAEAYAEKYGAPAYMISWNTAEGSDQWRHQALFVAMPGNDAIYRISMHHALFDDYEPTINNIFEGLAMTTW